MKRNKQIEFLERQLSEFYWPFYFRLQKDNAVWKLILDRTKKEDMIRQNVAKEIERNFILPNHDEAVKLIEAKIHLAKADEEFLDQLLVYIRHVAVYSAMRSSGIFEYDPIYLGEPWPAKLVALVEQKTRQLQQEYDGLIALGGTRKAVGP